MIMWSVAFSSLFVLGLFVRKIIRKFVDGLRWNVQYQSLLELYKKLPDVGHSAFGTG